MKVILKQTVPKVGKEGTVVTVKDGYARNYLFPRGLAILAEKKQVEALERRRSKQAAALAETKASAVALKEKLEGKWVTLPGKVGKETGKLFGAITAQDVADAIKAQHGIELEKRQVGVLEPIKRLGRTNIELDLHRDVEAHLNVLVFDPEHPETAQIPTEEEEEEVE